MKEYLFVIWDVPNDTYKFVKVIAEDEKTAKNKFTKAFLPFLNFEYGDLEEVIDHADIRIYYSEFKDITVV